MGPAVASEDCSEATLRIVGGVDTCVAMMRTVFKAHVLSGPRSGSGRYAGRPALLRVVAVYDAARGRSAVKLRRDDKRREQKRHCAEGRLLNRPKLGAENSSDLAGSAAPFSRSPECRYRNG